MTAGNPLRLRGFTLIELLVTLAVAIILATVAVPSFQSTISSNKLVADHNKILSGLNFARGEAVKRRMPVSVVVSKDADGVGWALEVKLGDESGLDDIDCSEPSDMSCLHVVDARGSSVVVSDGSDSLVVFNSLGRVGGVDCKKLDLTNEGEVLSVRVDVAGRVGDSCG